MRKSLRSVLCGLLFALTATMASASVLVCGDPGPEFNLPAVSCTGYEWTVEMDGLSPGDELLSFTVNVAAGGDKVTVFQVYGFFDDSSGWEPFQANFGLFLGDAATPWTEVLQDAYLYHNLFEQSLPEGPTVFTVIFQGPAGPLSGTPYAHVIFGDDDVTPAVPVPAALPSLLTGFALLGGLQAARRRRRQRV